MKMTNIYNLPPAIANAAEPYQPKEGRIGVTTLIDGPLPNNLKRKHWDEIEEDVLDRLWALRSQGAHKILELHAPAFSWPELKLKWPIDGITVVGVIDLYTPKDGLIEDYKDKSVWGFVFGGKAEIEKQLNCLAQLVRWHDWPVKTLRGCYFLRDWQRSRAGDEDYPPRPCLTMGFPLWGNAETYIQNRIKLHQQDNPPECTPEERWEKPTTWAVMKKGRKSAMRVLNTEGEAIQWRTDNGGDEIVKRPGRRVRCEDYCSVSRFCPYYKKVFEAEK